MSRHKNKYRAEAKAQAREYRKWKSCERKVRFESETDASSKATKDDQIYECQHCQGWHITNKVGHIKGLARALARRRA